MMLIFSFSALLILTLLFQTFFTAAQQVKDDIFVANDSDLRSVSRSGLFNGSATMSDGEEEGTDDDDGSDERMRRLKQKNGEGFKTSFADGMPSEKEELVGVERRAPNCTVDEERVRTESTVSLSKKRRRGEMPLSSDGPEPPITRSPSSSNIESGAMLARAFAAGRYEPPAQRPEMVPRMPSHQPRYESEQHQRQLLGPESTAPFPPPIYAPPPSPQLSFRSSNGQYAPLWSPAGASFAVPAPASVNGIAYYAPNGQNNNDSSSAGRPPVLFIGAFPPSAAVRPFHFQTPPPLSYITRYSPPNPVAMSSSSSKAIQQQYSISPGPSSSTTGLSGHHGPTANIPDGRQLEEESQAKKPAPCRNNSLVNFTNLPPISSRFPSIRLETTNQLTKQPKLIIPQPPPGRNSYWQPQPSSPSSAYIPGQYLPGPPLPTQTPYFPTLVSERTTARPEFTIPPPVGRFIPGRPFQPSSRTSTPIVHISSTPSVHSYDYNNERSTSNAATDQKVQTTEAPKEKVHNRAIGKARIICQESGVEFGIRTVFPFTGQIFAYDKKRVPSCVHTLHNERNINISFNFVDCGIRNQPQSANNSTIMEQFHLQIVVKFEQLCGASNVQSYFAQCEQNRVRYEKQKSATPRHIEEALEELRIIPNDLEQKAPIPLPSMRILTDVEHHKDGDGLDVNEVRMGQSLRIEFSLQPETDAYGFLVRNCIVRDAVSGVEHEVIDHKGCSTDLNIFAHPHYDTYHDIARVHWHAFKLPDQSRLSIRCRILLCTELMDSSGSISSCASLPTPPFCPELVTSPVDSVLADLPSHSAGRLKRSDSTVEQRVHVALCLGNSSSEFCVSEQFKHQHSSHLQIIEREWTENVRPKVSSSTAVCLLFPPLLVILFTLCCSFLLFAISANLLCRYVRRRHTLKKMITEQRG